jgi:hypothetical protein
MQVFVSLAFLLFAFLIRSWFALVARVPTRVWLWVWARPWSLARRVSLLFAPHVLVGALVLAWLGARAQAPERMADLQLRADAGARASVRQFVAPRDPSASVHEARRGNARRRDPAKAVQSGVETLGRGALFLFAVIYGAPLLVSLLFLGPLWTAIGLWIVRRAPTATIAGRPVTAAAVRRSSAQFPKWRAEADRNRTWLVGASATGRGPLLVGTDARVTHTWVVGATGTGKTQGVLLPMLRSDILAGRAVVFIDGKGDRDTIAAVWDLARRARREQDFRFFDLRTPDRSDSYSPMLSGTANEQCDRIMAALRWDNEYYRSQSQSVLLDVLRALRATRQPYSLDDVLVALSDLAALRRLAALVTDEERSELEAIARRWKDYQVETSGLRAQLKVLLSSDYGELLKDARPTLDLAEAYQERRVVYFALPVARYPEAAPLVAKLIIGDLNAVAGRVQDGEIPKESIAVVIDEFASFATPTFVDLLNKARSAGMAITIAHQSMRGDLATAGDGYVDRVADNTNIKICLRQSEDAEYVAGLGGTYQTAKRTEQTQDAVLGGPQRTGLGSVREVDEYVVSPNVIRELPPGWAVVKMNQPTSHLDLVLLDFVPTTGLAPYVAPLRPSLRAEGLRLRDPHSAGDAGLALELPQPGIPTFEGA